MRTISAMGSLLLIACGGAGTLRVGVSGEEAAVTGFSAEAFVDGWRVDFDALVVSLASFDLYGTGGAHAALDADPVLVDVTQGEQHAWTFEGVSARRWEDVRYRIAPATAEARDIGAIDPTIRERMLQEGLSILVLATARRGAVERRVDFGFTHDVSQSRCAGADGTDGIIVGAGALDDVEVTLHWDHLFFDSLALEHANMRFDAIAAAADETGVVTLEALSAQHLADLRGEDGEPLVDAEGTPIVYDPGSTPLSEPTLRGMIEAVAVTVGHLDGEGHCDYDATP